MKSHTEYLWCETKTRREVINIQDKVEAAVAKAKVKEGFCFIGAMHTSAAIWVNDADSGLLKDIEEFLEGLAPFGKKYRHHHPLITVSWFRGFMAALNLGWVTLRWENGKFRVHRYRKLRSRARLLYEHMPSVDRLLDLGSARSEER